MLLGTQTVSVLNQTHGLGKLGHQLANFKQNRLGKLQMLHTVKYIGYRARTGFSLCTFTHMEKPVFITGEPCFHCKDPVFVTGISL